MIIQKTSKTKIKNIYRDPDLSMRTMPAVYRVTTYWFLFIPVYRSEQFIT